jgi:peptidoglycan/LPS O-acetylase OafA/YrhL
LAEMLGCGALLLPTPPSSIPGSFPTHPLNSPCWSLLQEYLANVAYALVGWWLGRRALTAVVAVAALALVATALKYGSLDGGWAWHSLWMAPVRVAFPFAAGLLVLVFAAPAFVVPAYYHLFCMLVVFPLIVDMGAGATSAGRLSALCRFSGRLSYPLYLGHFPLTAIFMHWVSATHPPLGQLVLAMAALIAFLLLIAWAALRFYDEPIRAWLSARVRRPRLAPQLQGV